MSLIGDISYWWNVERPKARAKARLAQAERDLAAAVAEEGIVRALHDQCKTFLFADRLIKARKEVARFKTLIEQLKA